MMTTSTLPKPDEFKKIGFGNFAVNLGTVTHITLVEHNGNTSLEQVPPKYAQNEEQVKAYLQQRLNGDIEKGDNLDYGLVEFTCLEDLGYYDKELDMAVELLIAARDSTDKLEEVEKLYLQARDIILKKNPPTKASSHLLYLYSMYVAIFYEEELKEVDKAVETLSTYGSMICDIYPELGMDLLARAPEVMLAGGKYQESHKHFDVAIETTLSHKQYQKAIDLLDSELRQLKREEQFYATKNDSNMAQKLIIHQWSKMCTVVVLTIEVENFKIADTYYKDKLKLMGSNKFHVPGQDIAEQILGAFKDKDDKKLKQLGKSGNVRECLSQGTIKVLRNLDMEVNINKISNLNKKHSNKQL